MSKRKRPVITNDFKKEAVQLIATSGRTISQITADLGVGLSTLTLRKRQFYEAHRRSRPHEDVIKELARLRKEIGILRQEREILKRAATFSRKREVDEV